MVAQMPEAVRRCATSLGHKLRADLDALLLDVVVHGSAVLGDFSPGRSDLDALIVVADETPADRTRAIESTIAQHDSTPATGLEVSVVSEGQASAPSPPWLFLVHITTSPDDANTAWDEGAGDPDLILHYAVARETGWTVFGSDRRDIVGKVPRTAILGQLARELQWAVANASADYAVLNTCRAIEYQQTGKLVSKTGGGRWALGRGIRPDLVDAALNERESGASRLLDEETRDWVLDVAAALL